MEVLLTTKQATTVDVTQKLLVDFLELHVGLWAHYDLFLGRLVVRRRRGSMTTLHDLYETLIGILVE